MGQVETVKDWVELVSTEISEKIGVGAPLVVGRVGGSDTSSSLSRSKFVMSAAVLLTGSDLWICNLGKAVVEVRVESALEVIEWTVRPGFDEDSGGLKDVDHAIVPVVPVGWGAITGETDTTMSGLDDSVEVWRPRALVGSADDALCGKGSILEELAWGAVFTGQL